MRKTILLFSLTLITLGTFAQSKQVLFIGNSYTGVNNLPQLIKNIALSTGDSLDYVAHTPGGRRLLNHSGDASLHSKIRSRNWDYVTIQAQSQEPSWPIGQVQNEVFPHAKIICDSIRANNPCSMPLFYMTWGRKNGDSRNCANWPPVCTYSGMDSLLNLRYQTMAADNDALVSPVGAVWHYIRDSFPNIELYSSDGSHPSQAGSYAAACTFYSLIFQKDPTQISFKYTLEDSVLEQIRFAAKVVAYDSLGKWNVGAYNPEAKFSFTNTDSVFYFLNNSAHADSFYWDFGDGNTSRDPQPAYHYAMGGSYLVSLVASRCGQHDTMTQSISFSGTGFHGSEFIHPLHIFPNPSEGHIFIEDKNLFQVKDLMIVDITGKEVFEFEITDRQRLNLAGLPSGNYVLHLIDQDGKWYSGKILKK